MKPDAAWQAFSAIVLYSLLPLHVLPMIRSIRPRVAVSPFSEGNRIPFRHAGK
jgi:hypothetical protein